MQVKLTDIKVAENWSRPHGVGDVSELMDSLTEHGQLQPVLVSSDGYLAMGFRRFAAAEKLGWETIRIEKSEKNIDQLKAANLVENICRKDLTLWEEIEGIRNVFGESPNVAEVARKVSKSRNWVKPRVQVWTLPEDYIDQIRLNLVDISDLRGRLYNRKAPSPTTRYNDRPTENKIRDAITRLTEQGRIEEARALSFSLGTISYGQLLGSSVR